MVAVIPANAGIAGAAFCCPGRATGFFFHKGHKGNSKELRHCEELRLFCESKTNGDEAIHFFKPQILTMLRIVFFSAYWIPTFVGMTAILTFLDNEGGSILRIIK